MIELPQVTVIIVDTQNYAQAIYAIKKTLEQIKPAKTIWFTDRSDFDLPDVIISPISPIKSKADYSRFIIKGLAQAFDTSHCLVIQHDGYVIDGTAWDDNFLNYDYIGAPWLYPDPDRNVGNGGFSLRSKKLQLILCHDEVEIIEPEDEVIGRLYRRWLEEKWYIRFAPEKLAHKFSYELHEPYGKTFGFHGRFHPPFKPIVVVNRTGAMGDVIQVEPVLHAFHKQGYRVVLKTLPQFYSLFASHYFPVESFDTLNKALPYKYVDLDMAYEINPKRLHMQSYFDIAGIDGEIRSPKLNYTVDKSNTLFPHKYVCLHTDERQAGRSVYGVNWSTVVQYLNDKGYLVIHIGKGVTEPVAGAIRMNTLAEPMLAYLLAGCEFMLAVDSGPANVAVALGKKLIVFHGSVNPEYIWPDMTNIKVITNHNKETPICESVYCWHSVIGCEGVECYVSKYAPPCTQFKTEQVINAINELI